MGEDTCILIRPGSAGPSPQTAAKTRTESIRGRAFNSLPMAPRSIPEQRHIGLVVPVEMAAALEEKAANEDRSFSAECRVALRAHLAENESATPAEGDAFKDVASREPVNAQG
jgi:hypothetical protein